MDNREQLAGGNSNQVFRRGSTVVRQTGAWSPFVHQLLRFLNEKGFQEVPTLIATTANSETLSFIEGEVGHAPLSETMRSDAILVEAAQLLRRFHDLSAEFTVPDDAQFFLPVDSDKSYDVICHNDFAPYNCVFKDGHIVGIIDFDTAAPNERIRDIAYAVYRFAPLMTDAHCAEWGWQIPPDRAARLKLFCDAYGLDDRHKLIATVIQRIEALVQFMRDNAFNLSHIPTYLEDIAYIQENRESFETAIS